MASMQDAAAAFVNYIVRDMCYEKSVLPGEVAGDIAHFAYYENSPRLQEEPVAVVDMNHRVGLQIEKDASFVADDGEDHH